MALKEIKAVGALLTANGTSGGVVTIGSTTDWYPGQEAVLSNTDPASKRVRVTEILSATTMLVKPLPDSGDQVPVNYAPFGDVSAYTTVKTSRIDAHRQIVPVEWSADKLGNVPT